MFHDAAENEHDAAVVHLHLYHDLLNSVDPVDIFLNHLDNDHLFGLQYRLSPIEYAIHCIKKRCEDPDGQSTATQVTDNTSSNKGKTPPNSTNKQHEMEPLEDQFDVTGEQLAPNVIVGKHKVDDPEKLRPYLGYLPLQVIRETLKRTTQSAKAIVHFPFIRHIASRFAWMNRFRLREKVSTDVLFAHAKGLYGVTCAQVYYGMTSRMINVYPMKSKAEFPNTYADFLREQGIPTVLRRDGAKEEDSSTVKKMQRKHLVKDEFSEPHHQQQNPVELNAIKYLKHHGEALLDRTGAPKSLWFHAIKYIAGIHNHTAKESMRWAVPIQVRHGETPDISKYLMFKFYEPVYYSAPTGFGEINEKMGHWLGPSENVGDALCHEIYTDNGVIIHRGTVRSAEDKSTFNKRLGLDLPSKPQSYKPIFVDPPTTTGFDASDFAPANDDSATHNTRPTRSRKPPDILNVKDFDNAKSYFNARMNGILDPKWHTPVMINNYEVVHEHSDTTSTLGELHDESLPDQLAGFSTNQLESFRYFHLCNTWNMNRDNNEDKMWTPISIIKHFVNKNNKDDIHTVVKVAWLNGETSLQRLEDFARDHPNMVVDYAHDHDLQDQGEFSWTGKYKSLDKNDQLFSVYHMTTEHKAVMASRFHGQSLFQFGVEVPRNVAHALYLDKVNGNSLWADAITKELGEINMFKVFRAVLESDNLDEYQKIPYHIVFAVKFDGRRKARLVMGGHVTDTPKEDVYSGVVGINTVRLAFQLCALNDLQVCAADVGNAYLHGINKEKVYIVAGSEFGELQGKPLIVYKSCYGLKSSSARWHEHLAANIRKLNFRPSQADPDLYIREKDGHYEMLAVYSDDLLVFSKDPMAILDQIKKVYTLKGVGEPDYYLGGNVFSPINDHWTAEGITIGLSAETYINNSVKNFERLFDKQFRTSSIPMAEGDNPEMDDSPLCSPTEATQYRSLIGSANWIVTLGRFDIAFALQSLARFCMAPRLGHLERMKKLFGYLKHRPNGKILCDTSYPDHSQYQTPEEQNWDDFYPDAEEELPPDMPKPMGKPVRITCYVDADHAHCKMTRRSITGIILFINNMPIRWISKKQSTVETSTYGSELVAARIAVDLIVEMRYALRMLGVPIDGPALLLGDNNSVVLNTTFPSSQLKKKHNAVSYHRVRHACAAGILRFAHVSSEENIADLLTKSLGKKAFYYLTKKVLFRAPKMSKGEKVVENN